MFAEPANAADPMRLESVLWFLSQPKVYLTLPFLLAALAIVGVLSGSGGIGRVVAVTLLTSMAASGIAQTAAITQTAGAHSARLLLLLGSVALLGWVWILGALLQPSARARLGPAARAWILGGGGAAALLLAARLAAAPDMRGQAFIHHITGQSLATAASFLLVGALYYLVAQREARLDLSSGGPTQLGVAHFVLALIGLALTEGPRLVLDPSSLYAPPDAAAIIKIAESAGAFCRIVVWAWFFVLAAWLLSAPRAQARVGGSW